VQDRRPSASASSANEDVSDNSSSGGFVKDLTWLTDWVKRAQRQLEDLALRIAPPHDLRHRLHQLTADEKAILRRFISAYTRTQELSPSNVAVAALARDRILTTVTQVRAASAQWAYTLQPWIWTYLKEGPELLAE
jgi:superinfection exclusion protein B